MRKVVIIAMVCILVVLGVFVVRAYMQVQEEKHIESLQNSISELLNNEEFAEVFSIYNAEESKYTQYMDVQIEHYAQSLCAVASDELNTEKLLAFKEAGGTSVLVDNTINDINDMLDMLGVSEENYTNALNAYANRDFTSARQGFEAVVEEDENYSDARNYIAELDIRDESWNGNVKGRHDFYNAVCYDGEYLYVPFVLDGIDGIYKVAGDGVAADFFPLSDQPGRLEISSVNAVGAYIYFIAGENVGSGYTFESPYCIYEIKIDGTEFAVVKEGNFTDLFIKGDKVYAISREFGLVEYDRDFIQQNVICDNYVIDFSFSEDGVYYTVQEDLTYKSKNSEYFYNGVESQLLDSKEYMHYYRFGDEYVRDWQHNSAFETLGYGNSEGEIGIRNADIFDVYGMLERKILYSCNESLGREILYTYETGSGVTTQIVDSRTVIDYEVLGVSYELGKLIIEKDGKLSFSDISIANLQEIGNLEVSDKMLGANSAVLRHLQDSDIYTDSPEEQIISVIYDKQNWHYKDDKMNVTIEKRYMDEYDCNVYVTHIFTNDYSLLTTGNADTESLTAQKTYKANYISDIYKTIYAQNTDTFVYDGNSDQGIIFRQGELVRDIFLEDMIVYFEDGSMEIYKMPEAVNSQMLLDKGVELSFSFGPVLVDDYEVDRDCATGRLAARNPRSAIGYVEPGHYVMIASDGRDYKVSRGLTFIQLANIFADEGCKSAYNLDGGMTTTVLFMGNYVTHRPPYGSGSEWFFYRSVAEMFYVGSSETSPLDLNQFACDYNYFADNYK